MENPPGAHVYLRDLSGITRQKVHPLTATTTVVGRKEVTSPPDTGFLIIRQIVISRRHAVIERRADGYWLSDCGSVNGAYVNNVRVREPVLLKSGDCVRFHEYEFDFVQEGPSLLSTAQIQAAAPLAGAAKRREGYRSGDEDDDTLLYQ